MTGLKIKYWYHALTYVGAAAILASVPFEFKGIPNESVLHLAGAAFFIGIGEWINHPLQTTIVPPNSYTPNGGTITSYNRSPCILGNLIVILGFILIGRFALKQYGY